MPLCYKQPGPPPPTASCYICLENNADDNNQPLLRNCACRGDAGWAHIACLTEFAASKITEEQRKQDPSPSFNMESIWNDCILCKTPYMQYMGLAMAKAFVKQYEHLPDTDTLRFASLYSLAKSRFDVDDYDGGIELLVRLQPMCDVLTSIGVDVRGQKGTILGMIGAVFLRKGKYNDALTTFERQREIAVAVYGPNSRQTECNDEMIVRLKEKIGIGKRVTDPAAELVVARQRFRESQGNIDIVYRLNMHIEFVNALRNDGKIQESMEQLEKVLTESRQSLGPDHPETLRFENRANEYRHMMAAGATTSQKKEVWAVIDCEQQPAISGQRVQVLRATKDGQKYICLIKNDKGVSTKFKVTQNQFILEAGTSVVVHGLVSSADLNGSIGFICSFDKEKRRYAVSVGKKKAAVSIKPINLNVDFTY